MISDLITSRPRWFGFSYPKAAVDLPFLLLNCGYGFPKGSPYSWSGRARGNQRRIVWQYTVSGLGCLQVGTKTYDLIPGTAFMVEVPSDHRYFFPKESSDWRFVYATLAGSGSFQLLGEVIERVGPMASFPRSSNTLAIFEQIYRTVRRGRELDQVENSIRAYSLVAAIRVDLASTGLPSDGIEAAVQLCHKRLANPIGVDDMASAAGLSRFHFCREFRKQLNTSPAAFLRRLRLEKARRLLRETRMSIKQVSFACGFPNCNHFCRAFRLEYKTPPGAFRASDPIYDNRANF